MSNYYCQSKFICHTPTRTHTHTPAHTHTLALYCLNFPKLHNSIKSASPPSPPSTILRVYFFKVTKEHCKCFSCYTQMISGQHLNLGKNFNRKKSMQCIWKSWYRWNTVKCSFCLHNIPSFWHNDISSIISSFVPMLVYFYLGSICFHLFPFQCCSFWNSKLSFNLLSHFIWI